MTIPNVVLGELIDPVTFGNAVVDEVNSLTTGLANETAARIAGDATDYTVLNATILGGWAGLVQFGQLGPLPIYQLSVTLFGAEVDYQMGDEVVKGLPAAAMPYVPGTLLKFTLRDESRGITNPVSLGFAGDGSLAVLANGAFTALDLRGYVTWIAPDRSSFSAHDIRAMVEEYRSMERDSSSS